MELSGHGFTSVDGEQLVILVEGEHVRIIMDDGNNRVEGLFDNIEMLSILAYFAERTKEAALHRRAT